MKQKKTQEEEVDKESLKSLLDLGQGCASELSCFSKSGETNQREVLFSMLLFSRNTAEMLERGVSKFFFSPDIKKPRMREENVLPFRDLHNVAVMPFPPFLPLSFFVLFRSFS